MQGVKKEVRGLCTVPFQCSEDGKAIELCNRNTGTFFKIQNCYTNQECLVEGGVPACRGVEDLKEAPNNNLILILLALLAIFLIRRRR